MTAVPSHDQMQRDALNQAWDLGFDAAADWWLPGAGYCDLIIWRRRRPLVVVEFKARILNVGQLLHAVGQVRRYCRWFPSHGCERPPAYAVAAELAPEFAGVIGRGYHGTEPVSVAAWQSFALESIAELTEAVA